MMDPRMYPPPPDGAGTDFVKHLKRYTVSLDPASVAANTSAEQDLTVAGLQAGDLVVNFYPTAALTAGLVISHARVKSANTLAVTFGNHTASPINQTALTFELVTWRLGTV